MKIKQIKKGITLIVCFLLLGMICPTDIQAATIKLNKSTATIYIGKTVNLKITGTTKKVTWSTSDKKIATVNSNGKVTGKKAGKATITAKVGKKNLKCEVKVKSVLSANKTSIEMDSGEKEKVKITMKKSGTVSAKIEDTDVVSCSWGEWSENIIPLTIQAKSSGSTIITITNDYNNEKIKIKVIVPNPWDSVEVIIPETIGEQDAPSNRMKITDYSFYNATYGGALYYYMDYQYKLVKYGKSSRSNWGEYFYCYDKNGNILKKCYIYASSLALNRTYADDAMIPLDTAKIVFMEYLDNEVDMSEDDSVVSNNETNVPDDSGTSNKWLYIDAYNLKNYADRATTYSEYAFKYYNSAFSSVQFKKIYANQSLEYIKQTKKELESALQLVNSKETLTTNEGKTLSDMINETIEIYNTITVENVNDENIDIVMKQLENCVSNGNIRCIGIFALSIKLLETFQYE